AERDARGGARAGGGCGVEPGGGRMRTRGWARTDVIPAGVEAAGGGAAKGGRPRRHQAGASGHAGEYLNGPTACQPRFPAAATTITLSPLARRSGTPYPGIRAWHAIIPELTLRKDDAVDATLLASNLGFPEGPVVMPDGAIVLCDGNTGELLVWKDGAMGRFADTGGSPW